MSASVRTHCAVVVAVSTSKRRVADTASSSGSIFAMVAPSTLTPGVVSWSSTTSDDLSGSPAVAGSVNTPSTSPVAPACSAAEVSSVLLPIAKMRVPACRRTSSGARPSGSNTNRSLLPGAESTPPARRWYVPSSPYSSTAASSRRSSSRVSPSASSCRPRKPIAVSRSSLPSAASATGLPDSSKMPVAPSVYTSRHSVPGVIE